MTWNQRRWKGMKGNERKRKEMKVHERKMLGNMTGNSARLALDTNSCPQTSGHGTMSLWALNRIQRGRLTAESDKGNGTEKKNNYEVIKELKGIYKAGYTTWKEHTHTVFCLRSTHFGLKNLGACSSSCSLQSHMSCHQWTADWSVKVSVLPFFWVWPQMTSPSTPEGWRGYVSRMLMSSAGSITEVITHLWIG